MKPRIVILSAFLTPFRSGAEACAEEVPLRLADQFDFTIITARLRKDLLKKDVLRVRSGDSRISATNAIPVIRIGIGHSIDKWLYPFLAPFAVRKLQPDIVHGILETFAGLALHFCRFTYSKAKRILTLQTTNRSFLKGMIVHSPDRVTAISKHLTGIAAELGRKDVKVIPNGINYDAIRSACAQHAKVPGRILFVGRLERMKGVDLLLTAYARANSEFGMRNAELHIVGNGSQRSALENLARALGISDRVTFKGYLQSSDVNREYAEAEIFCGLSRSEALGNVFIEAQAAGCAIVASRAGGIAEVVEEGKSAILVDPQDIDSVARALQTLLGKDDPADASKVADYDWNLIANQYAEVYTKLKH